MHLLDGVKVSASSSCTVQKEFPQICEIQWQEEYCHICDNTTDNFAPESIFGPSQKFWSSAIMVDKKKKEADLDINFRNSYEFSGLYFHLGPGILPRQMEIFYHVNGTADDFRLWHVVNFDATCKITHPDYDSEILCQNVPNRPNQEFYVNLLSRRPSQYSLAASAELLNFLTTDQIKIRFVGMMTHDGIAVTNQFFSLRRFGAFGRCRCNGNTDVCKQLNKNEPLQCYQCQRNRHGKSCEHCLSFVEKFNNNNTCPECECNGQSESCSILDSDMAICQQCRGNSRGNNCEFCQDGFYRATGNAKEICIRCDCYTPGSKSETCSRIGQCECGQGYRGRQCQYVDEDVLLWNENTENDQIDSTSHIKDRCRSAMYSCPAGDVFDNSCGNVAIVNEDGNQTESCSIVIDLRNKSHRQLISISIANLASGDLVPPAYRVINMETNNDLQITDRLISVCSAHVRFEWTTKDKTSFEFAWESSESDYECEKIKSTDEQLTQQLSDAKSYVEEYLIRSIRYDPDDFSHEMANNFLSRFKSIHKNFETDLAPVQDMLGYMKLMLEQSRVDQSDDFNLLEKTQNQLVQVAEQLENHIDEADVRLLIMSQKVEDLIASGFQDAGDVDEVTLDELTATVDELTSSEKDFNNEWELLDRLAESELKYTRQLFDIVHDRFGQASEEGKCWFADNEGVKTFDRFEKPMTDSSWQFDPIEMEGFGDIAKTPLSDRDHFPNIDWLDMSDLDITMKVDWPLSTNDKFSMDFYCDEIHYSGDNTIVSSQNDAQKQCSNKGEVLAQFRNTEHLTKFISEMDSRKHDNLGIILTGLQVVAHPAPWEWELQSAKVFHLFDGWQKNEPKPDHNSRCAATTSDGWVSLPCNRKLQHYVCMGRILSADESKEKKYRYRFFIRSVIGGGFTYQQAVNGCSEKGWFLAPIAGPQHNSALLRIFDTNKNLREAWIGLRAPGASSEISWQWSDGSDIPHDLLKTKLQNDVENKITAVQHSKKSGCLAVNNVNNSLAWQVIDCNTENVRFVCSTPIGSTDPISRRKRHLVHRPDHDPESIHIVHPPQNFHDLFSENFNPLEIVDVIHYDWKWPRYGWLADQKRCVDIMIGTFQNLTRYSSNIQTMSNEAFSKSLTTTNAIGSVEDDMNNNEYIQNALTGFETINDNLQAAEQYWEKLKKYHDYLSNGLIKINDITIQSFEVKFNQYSSSLDKLIRDWSCDGSEITDFINEHEDLLNSDVENLFDPVCFKVCYILCGIL